MVPEIVGKTNCFVDLGVKVRGLDVKVIVSVADDCNDGSIIKRSVGVNLLGTFILEVR